jgi:predicted SAM-dependent methyltransferase
VQLGVAIDWLTEVRRILVPGGRLRLTTPDLSAYVEGYLHDNGFFAEHRRRLHTTSAGAPDMPARRAYMLNQIFYLWGHRWIYDLDELRYALTRAGFGESTITRCAFRRGERADVAMLDRASRKHETMYVEAQA